MLVRWYLRTAAGVLSLNMITYWLGIYSCARTAATTKVKAKAKYLISWVRNDHARLVEQMRIQYHDLELAVEQYGPLVWRTVQQEQTGNGAGYHMRTDPDSKVLLPDSVEAEYMEYVLGSFDDLAAVDDEERLSAETQAVSRSPASESC